MKTEFMIDGNDIELKCVLPCSGSSECACLSGWSVTLLSEVRRLEWILKLFQLNVGECGK